MKTDELLKDTIKELEKEEQMIITGGKSEFWENAAYVYGAVMGGFSTCSFPVGMLSSTPHTGGGQICTIH